MSRRLMLACLGCAMIGLAVLAAQNIEMRSTVAHTATADSSIVSLPMTQPGQYNLDLEPGSRIVLGQQVWTVPENVTSVQVTIGNAQILGSGQSTTTYGLPVRGSDPR